MRFRDIPKFVHGGNYAVDVSWSYLEEWLQAQVDDGTGLDLDPDFQRGHVWDDRKRVAYVEYILRGGMSSKSLWWNCKGWNHGRRDTPLTIVDGKQRMEAVRMFLRNELCIFANLDKRKRGFVYTEFTDKLGIIDAAFRMHVNNLETKELVLQWYLDLNEGGVVHTEEELTRVRGLLEQEKKRGAK